MGGMHLPQRTVVLAPLASIAALGLLAGAALPPGAPGSAGGSTGHGTHAATVSAGDGALDEDRLRSALLDHTDFPQGWAGDSSEQAERRGIGVPRPTEDGCRELFEPAGDGSGTARAGFARTHAGPFVVTVAAAHGDEAGARAAMEGFARAARECATFHAEEGAERNPTTVSYTADGDGSSPEGLGEEAAALRFTRESEAPGEAAVVAEVVIARVGAHTVRIAQAGRDDAAAGGLTGLAERAVEKLQQVTEGHTPEPLPDQPGATEL
ncbi:hypothetical protein MTQ13_02365 [Streptomyces sp. XM4011]|uniref:hypothetical protein n=1 Tax=Streptomyces TaxID=1883 RepID=UPI001FFB6B30|nr:hypothetical protein [Streptomyces sp. XM4011]MCK1813124.1 hypothetical protein [Streptomyces sp. XM4011]